MPHPHVFDTQLALALSVVHRGGKLRDLPDGVFLPRKKARERVALSTGLAQHWRIEQNAPISRPEDHPNEAHMARLVLFFAMMINPSRYAWKRLVPVLEQLKAGQPK